MAVRDHNPHKRRLYLPLTVAPSKEPAAPAVASDRPEWLKVSARIGANYAELKGIMRSASLHTVCEEASCPNIFECWDNREATFLVLGDACTRRCGFCDVMTAKPLEADPDEPARIAEAVQAMRLEFVVLTGVARDDLEDGGATVWAECIHAIRELTPTCGIEVLPTDFRGDPAAIGTVLHAQPDVFAHNLETVRRLHSRIRPAFDYDRSLGVLRTAKDIRPGQITKSNLILGMGEQPDEIPGAMHDLRGAGCDILTIGQYLKPTEHHLPVDRWVHPNEFASLAEEGREMGFAHVESGPLVRSSFRAGRQYASALAASGPSA